MCVRHLQLDNLSSHQRAEVGIYKRKKVREKVSKHAFDQDKKRRTHELGQENNDLDCAIDQEKKQVLGSYFFSFINYHLQYPLHLMNESVVNIKVADLEVEAG